MSIVALDVDYGTERTRGGWVRFSNWGDEAPLDEGAQLFPPCTESYTSGEFYRRELKYLLAMIGALDTWPDLVVVDGYVWLGAGRPGLGAHLHKSLSGTPVVGVAKREFQGNSAAIEVLRGTSKRPLYVTAVGIDVGDSAKRIAAMAGVHRIPALLKRADDLARRG